MDWLNRAKQLLGNFFGGAQRTIGNIAGGVARNVVANQQQANRFAQQVVSRIPQVPRFQLPQVNIQAPRIQMPQAPKVDLAGLNRAFSDYYKKTALSQTTPANFQKAVSNVNLNNFSNADKFLKQYSPTYQKLTVEAPNTAKGFAMNVQQAAKIASGQKVSQEEFNKMNDYFAKGFAPSLQVGKKPSLKGFATDILKTGVPIGVEIGSYTTGAKLNGLPLTQKALLVGKSGLIGGTAMAGQDVLTGQGTLQQRLQRAPQTFATNAALTSAGEVVGYGASKVLGKAANLLKKEFGIPEKKALEIASKKAINISSPIDKNAPITVRTLPEKGALLSQGYTNVKVKFTPKPGEVTPTIPGRAIAETAPKGPKGQEALYAEARKYATPEEFAKAQGTSVYHGTNAKISDITQLISNRERNQFSGARSVFASANKKYAKTYGKNVLEGINTGKTLDTYKLAQSRPDINTTVVPKEFSDYLTNPILTNRDRNVLRNNFFTGGTPSNIVIDHNPNIQKYFASKGYSAIQIPRESVINNATEMVITDKSKIKSTQQLTDIWNQANKQGPQAIYETAPVPKKFEILPTNISTSTEASAVGAKRIAPDRIGHQQLTPEAGINKIIEQTKAMYDKRAAGWAKVANDVDVLIKKYGDKLPARTASNLSKYPELKNDYIQYNYLKKNTYGSTSTLTNMKNQFLDNVKRTGWNAEREAAAIKGAPKTYIEAVKKDISKGYRYPEAVLNYDKSFKTAIDSRARYEKGLYTSFSSDDYRIVFDNKNRISAGMKRQDGKDLLPVQKNEIINGVLQTQNALGINMDQLAKDNRWVFVHLNDKNPFLTKNTAGLYRSGKNYASISVGGTETFTDMVDGKRITKRVNTTMAHELGHALDLSGDKRLFSNDIIWQLKNNYNKVEGTYRSSKYWASNAEVTARAIAQYVDVIEGHTSTFNKPGNWNKEIFNTIIKPQVEKSLIEKYPQYKIASNIKLKAPTEVSALTSPLTSPLKSPLVSPILEKQKILPTSSLTSPLTTPLKSPLVSPAPKVPFTPKVNLEGSNISTIKPKISISKLPIQPEPPKTSIQTVIDALGAAKPIRGQQERLYTIERGKRIAKVAAMGEKVPGEKGYFAQLGQLKGQLPKAQFEGIRKQLSQPVIDDLFNQVEKANISPFEKVTAKTGLAKLLGSEGGVVPTRGELTLLNEVFPKEFMDAVLAKRTTLQKLGTMAGEVFNLPRSIMSTVDLSAPLRQGVFLIGRPKQFIPAFASMIKYAGSEKAYQGLQQQIRSRSTYQLMRQSKLALTDINAPLTSREEAFMSNLAEKIPGFGRLAKASDRAYTGFLNKLRADVFDDLVTKAKATGALAERPQIADDIANFVNAASGRGKLPNALERSAVALNAAFFSPRLMASRFNLLNPVYYVKLDPFVRKEALKSLFTFAATGASILGLAKAAGADVGVDPRSSDFGKIKIGNTRYDPWGGFQQYIVLASRLLTGEMISSTTGKQIKLAESYKDPTRLDIIQRFLESKQAPIASFVTGFLKGKTSTGENFNLPAEIADRFLPMMTQDMYDLYKEYGPKGIAMGIPGIFGVGSQTYQDQIPMKTVTKSGKETTTWRQAPSLGETLVNKVTNKQVTNVPAEQIPALQAQRKLEIQYGIDLDKVKAQVLESGQSQTIYNPVRKVTVDVFLKDGVVTTKDQKTKQAKQPKVKVSKARKARGGRKGTGRARVSLRKPRISRIRVAAPKGTRKISFKVPTPTKARKSIKIKTG